MNFNSKTGFSEQDYQLVKENMSELGALSSDIKALAEKSPKIDFGPGSFTIEKDVPFYGFVAGLIRETSIEDVLGGNTNVSCNSVNIQNPIGYGNYPDYYPELAPIIWDGTKGSYTSHSLGAVIYFTLSDDTKPGILTISSTNIYTIKTNLKD